MKIQNRIIDSSAIFSLLAISSVSSALAAFLPLQQSVKTLIMLVVITCSTLFLLYRASRIRPFLGGVEGGALFLFVALSLFSCLLVQLSGERMDTMKMWGYTAQAFSVSLAYWGCYVWASSRYHGASVDLGVLVMTVISIASVLFEVSGVLQYESSKDRYFGFMGDSVAWLITCSGLYYLVRRKYTILILCIVALICTQSRGPLIVFVLGIMLYLFLTAELSKAQKHLFAIGGFAFLCFVISFYPDFLLENFGRLYSTDFINNDRVRTTEFSLEIFSRNPLTGLGYHAHTYFYNMTVGNYMRSGNEFWAIPVSTWAQVLADSGLAGFIPYVAFVMLVVRASFITIREKFTGNEYRSVAGLSVWLISFLVFNQSAAWLLPGSLLSPIVFAASGLVVGSRYKRNLLQRKNTGQTLIFKMNGSLA